MSDKLPEWPEDLKHGSVSGHDEFVWLDESLTAALARMEALVEYAQHTGAWCGQNSGHACTCGLSELLAACERRES